MTTTPSEIVVIMEPQPVEVVVIMEPAPEVVVEMSEVGMVGPKGDEGPPGQDVTAELNDHIQSPRPHLAAESGKDFAGWFTAGIA